MSILFSKKSLIFENIFQIVFSHSLSANFSIADLQKNVLFWNKLLETKNEFGTKPNSFTSLIR